MDRGFQKRCVTFKVRTPCSSCRGFTTNMSIRGGPMDRDFNWGSPPKCSLWECKWTGISFGVHHQHVHYGRANGQGFQLGFTTNMLIMGGPMDRDYSCDSPPKMLNMGGPMGRDFKGGFTTNIIQMGWPRNHTQ